jgi:protein gp37
MKRIEGQIMAQNSKIEWTENTWNPVTGCTKCSDGCLNCYAFTLAYRLQQMGVTKYRKGFEVTLHDEALNEPLKWKKPSMIFVNSMSDIYHEAIPAEYIECIFKVMNKALHHTFQLLTKRPDRMLDLHGRFDWTPNIWQGVTVESPKYLDRIEKLREVRSAVKFVSFEPLIADVGYVDLTGIDWAIVGGESGAQARPMFEDWVLNIKEACEEAGTLFYFKQWGGRNKKQSGRELLGRTWDDIPNLQTQMELVFA